MFELKIAAENIIFIILILFSSSVFSQPYSGFAEHKRNYSEGYAAVMVNWKWGFINEKGKLIVECKYCEAYNFKNGLATVYIDDEKEDIPGCSFENRKAGIINTSGEEVIPPVYDEIRFLEGTKLIRIQKGEIWGASDYSGNIILPLDYSWIGPVDEETGFVKVKKNKKVGAGEGYVKQTGEVVIPCNYKFTSVFIDGLVYASINTTKKEREELRKTKRSFYYQRSGVLDTLGNIVIPCVYNGISRFRNGYVEVSDTDIRGGNKSGYFNREGNLVIPPIYSFGTNFSEDGRALVQERFNSAYYFIDTNNNRVTTPKFYTLSISPRIRNNLIAVKQSGLWGFINTKDEVVIDFKYDNVEAFCDGLAHVYIKNKIGFINTKGYIIIPIEYDKGPYYFDDEIEKFELNGEEYYYNRNGEQVEKP